ncbi:MULTISPECIES: hypothetical protein [Solibacillus]|uniref:hypothetical protein n=1 Tax=Solibacillus TaxID=648800 RepID=UPI0030F55F93
MTGQLNLFDWIEPATSSEIAAASKPIEQKEPPILIVEESVVAKQPIEMKEECTEVAPSNEPVTEDSTVNPEDIYVGQSCRIILPKKDTELYDYLKYYFPFVIDKTGDIEEITFNAKGDCICNVKYAVPTFYFILPNSFFYSIYRIL